MAKKMKVSLDLAKIKSFFVQHVEKIAFGGCALVLLLLLYKAISLETYERLPKQISDKASEKERMLQQASWSADRIQQENLTQPELDKEIAESRTAIAADRYGITPFNKPLFETRTKRIQPTLLPPEKPEVASDLVAFVVVPPSATVDPAALAGGQPPAEELGPPGGGFSKGGFDKGGPGGPVGPPGGFGKGGGPMGRSGGPMPRMGGGAMLAQAGADPGFPVGAGQKRVAIPFTVVKLLVPMKKQSAIYREAFAKSVQPDPSRDTPSYLGFIVERQEIGGSDAENKPAEVIKATRWSTIADMLAKRNQTFAGYAPEVANPAVVHPALTHPLGPKTESGWEVTKVVHSELATAPADFSVTLEVASPEETPVEDGAPKDDQGPDPFAQDPNAQPGGRPGGPMGSKGGSGPLGNKGGGQMGGNRFAGGRFQATASATGEVDTEYYLLRFFDFNVEPGKSYRYRVQLGLSNPNNGIDVKYLENPELAKDKVLLTDWSELSPAVSVPRESYLLVGEASRGASGGEPSLDLIAVKMVADLGIKAAVKQRTQLRGQIGNWRGEKVDLSAGEPETPAFAPPPDPDDKGPKPPKTTKPKDKAIDLLTDTLLVDIRGGDPLARAKEPAEALVLTPSGRLTVRSQVGDAEEYKHQEQKLEEARKRKTQKEDPEPAAGPFGGRVGPKGK